MWQRGVGCRAFKPRFWEGGKASGRNAKEFLLADGGEWRLEEEQGGIERVRHLT